MGTHNLCFEQKYETHQNFSAENFSIFKAQKSLFIGQVFIMKTSCLFKMHSNPVQVDHFRQYIYTKQNVIWAIQTTTDLCSSVSHIEACI